MGLRDEGLADVDGTEHDDIGLTPAEAIQLIRQRLAEGKTDGDIAAELNLNKIRTGAREAWEVSAVRRVRYYHGMHRVSRASRRVPDRRPDELLSIHGVAAELGVTQGVVRRWIRRGFLEPVVGGGGRGSRHALWFRLDEAACRRLDEAKRSGGAPRRHKDGQD